MYSGFAPGSRFAFAWLVGVILGPMAEQCFVTSMVSVRLGVTLTEDTLIVDLVDGRTVSVPLAWYPRLAHGTPTERANWRLIGRGEGIHWPDLDEDINVAGLLAGRPSGETQISLQRWLESRHTAR